jgi:hypothetical protein
LRHRRQVLDGQLNFFLADAAVLALDLDLELASAF